MVKSLMKIVKAMLLALPLLFIGCKNNSNNLATDGSIYPKIILEKTRCYRQCPIYRAEFFVSDLVIINPVKYFYVKNKSKGKMKKGRLSELLKEAKKIKFWELEDIYDNKNLQDAPTTFITVIKKNKRKKIKVRANAPEKLKHFIQLVEKELKTMKWTSIK
jgi:hypothetical protein